MSLVNINQILTQALKKHYAILHANVISYDMTKAVILAANQACAPIIVAVSEKALQGFADPKDFVLLVKNILNHYKIKIPVAIHLDHGSYNVVLQAIQSGFTSVMYDGSKLALQENLKCTKKIVALAHKKNISVECEVGTVLGKLEDVNIQGQLATVEECKLMAQTGINALAAGIGNLHGKYPPN
jgi:fructose-bisphosphate aldolase class II